MIFLQIYRKQSGYTQQITIHRKNPGPGDRIAPPAVYGLHSTCDRSLKSPRSL
jgi:hypothetical protein